MLPSATLQAIGGKCGEVSKQAKSHARQGCFPRLARGGGAGVVESSRVLARLSYSRVVRGSVA